LIRFQAALLGCALLLLQMQTAMAADRTRSGRLNITLHCARGPFGPSMACTPAGPARAARVLLLCHGHRESAVTCRCRCRLRGTVWQLPRTRRASGNRKWV